MSQPIEYGDISFATGGKDGKPTATLHYDRLAVDNHGNLLLVSLVASGMEVKAIRAILNSNGKIVINASGGKIKRPSDPKYKYAETPGRLGGTDDGYSTYAHKMQYGQVHAMWITRQSGFMPVLSEDALWQELNDNRFTTPILREWMPWIEKSLREKDLLQDARSFNVHCGVLAADTSQLDEIVTTGLKNGHITIPAPPILMSEAS